MSGLVADALAALFEERRARDVLPADVDFAGDAADAEPFIWVVFPEDVGDAVPEFVALTERPRRRLDPPVFDFAARFPAATVRLEEAEAPFEADLPFKSAFMVADFVRLDF